MHNENKKSVLVEGEFKGKKLTIESGKLAHQADSGVVVTLGETTVFASVVSKPAAEELDFFPLRVDYEERFYAGGTIGGSRFMRREGRPNDAAVVSGRLIDHAIRPLFPKDFMDETQLIVTVLSIDGEIDPALLGFLAASAALSTSGVPFNGPIVPLRISRQDGEMIADLSVQSDSSDMDILASYLDNGSKVQAIEAHAHVVPEEEIVKGIKLGAEESKSLFDLLHKFNTESEVETIEYTKSWLNKDSIESMKPEVMSAIKEWASKGLYYSDPEWSEAQEKLIVELAEKHEDTYSKGQISALVGEVQKEWVREMVVSEKKRIDGRGFDELRKLSAEVGVLPRVHGTGLFARGLTQSLSVATLASPQQKQLINGMSGDNEKHYIHHYNFPPYSVGEVGRVGGANRRAIGHGILAENALLGVLPSEIDFPYAIRVVSEIMSSNGSTSMAATCASSLSLMDAGVPIKGHVGGIGIGLFVDKSIENPSIDDYMLLTDIVGYEDFAGYMDFKMTGTKEGVTAIQLELKLNGLPVELMDKMFGVSKDARHKVIDVMTEAIPEPRKELSEYAPKVDVVQIDKDFIGKIIGSGGAMIKEIMEISGAELDVEEKDDFALVAISSPSEESIAKAKEYVEGITAKIQAGDEFEGVVTRIEDYGAFVEIMPTREGLLHVSEVSYEFVDDINSVVTMGETVKVKVISTEMGKISLSMKALMPKPEGYQERPPRDNNRGGGRGGYNNRGRGNNRGGGNRRNNNRY